MVPVTATANRAVSSALRKQIAETCGRELSKAFVAWLLKDFNEGADLLSMAARASERAGAGQDFQTIAILGFAADARVLSERELAGVKKGLSRLAGRSPVVSGVPMPFCADAVGILGIALGTAVLANAEVTGQVVGWAMRFLKRAYERDRAEEWQRCLFAAADLKLGTPLKLPLPNGAAVADVRVALLSKGLIDYPETQLQQDAARVLEMTIQEPPSVIDCERAAIRLAGLEWIIRKGSRLISPSVPAARMDAAHDTDGHEPQGPKESRNAKNPLRRNVKYQRIDTALVKISAARPKNHEEVFRILEDRKVAIPNRRPFQAAGGWLKGFQQNRHLASVWLSQTWGRLNLPAFRPGPKK
jgi:hypothetical protein